MEAATMDRPATDGKAAELKENAGEPVGDMPAQTPESPQPDVDKIVVEGSMQLDIFSALGGKMPTEAVLGFKGKAEIDGAYLKGERIKGTFEAIVRADNTVDKVDPKTGQVVSCKVTQTAELLDLQIDGAG